MTLKRLTARISSVADLSPTAREVALSLPEPLGFSPGAFVNTFMTVGGKKERRAYSISSSEEEQSTLTLSIRKGRPGGMSEAFFEPGVLGRELEVVGPLGLNTAEKFTRERVFLFAFGIGIAPVKGLLPHLLKRKDIREITVVTGSRFEDEVLYRDYLESLAAHDARLTLRFAVSRPTDPAYPYRGHIQDHVADLEFSGTTVYLCGSKDACATLKTDIEARSTDVEFLVEAFD